MLRGLATAHRKWPTAAFARKLSRLGIARMLRVELIIATASGDLGLRGSGLIAINPPWTLHDELKLLMPALAGVLGRGGKAKVTLGWLAGETCR
jgi:23S rRNA (adenine2030-N6)-methyltransferase